MMVQNLNFGYRVFVSILAFVSIIVTIVFLALLADRADLEPLLAFLAGGYVFSLSQFFILIFVYCLFSNEEVDNGSLESSEDQ